MKKNIKVFIASPGDLSAERKAFREVIKELNSGFGDGANVEFEALGWEDTLATTGRRNQSVINEEVDLCDIFVLALYRRWGQDAPDAKPCSSYTEEEFHRALARWQKEEKPEIFVFFKRVDPESEADPGPQLKQVMKFRRDLEETRHIIYRTFQDENQFIQEIDRHLRAFAKNELPKSDKKMEILILPSGALEEIEKANKIVQESIAEAERAKNSEKTAILRLEAVQLQMAKDAANLARDGRPDFARQIFSELVVNTNNIDILYLGYEFFYGTGDLVSAKMVLEKWLNLGGGISNTSIAASVYTNLGNIYLTEGDLEQAEHAYLESIKINKSLNRADRIAGDYGNLGIIYRIRGNHKKAESYYQNSLAINKEIGRKDGVAKQLTNLGVLYQIQGDLQKAEDMFRESLAINESISRKEGVAKQWGNIGNIYLIKGDLLGAEALYHKSLKINTDLDRKVAMATDLNNLGIISRKKGDLNQAKKFHEQALLLNQIIGRREGLANDYGSLGSVYVLLAQPDSASPHLEHLETAKTMYLKALTISQSMGHKEGMVMHYRNLGMLYRIWGKPEQEIEMNALADNVISSGVGRNTSTSPASGIL